MYQRILVPLDGSATSDRGLEEAIRLARLTGARLRLIHVIDELSFSLAMDASAGYAGDLLGVLRENGAKLLAQASATVRAAGVEVESVMSDNFAGPVHEQVAADAAKWPADLIVLGTHGRRGVSRVMLGSSAERILRTAPVPVLLVRAPEATAAKAEAVQAPAHVSLPSAALKVERV